MANRLRRRLTELQSIERKALVCFITAGDPRVEATVPALHALVAAGADVIELGVPFSDPEAEGPAIQRASERALAQGMTLRGAMAQVEAFRAEDNDTPVVLMGYLNSVLRYGEVEFAQAAKAAGVDGLIMVNLPPEEGQSLQQALGAEGIDLIYLIAPTTTPERQDLILERCGGFVYYVSLKGTTGAGNLQPEVVRQAVAGVKARTDLPVMVGFGIKNGDSARAVAEGADGVVVGSALVDILGNDFPEEASSSTADDTPSGDTDDHADAGPDVDLVDAGASVDTEAALAERTAAAAALVAEIREALDSLAG
ncbi:MAG: tryptophan synthase subunit alpha [Pseudomonadota bacterium]